MALETLFSFCFSPILMIRITQFVWLWLRRKSVAWDSQTRGGEPLRWDVCIRRFGWISVLGVTAWIAMAHQIRRKCFDALHMAQVDSR